MKSKTQEFAAVLETCSNPVEALAAARKHAPAELVRDYIDRKAEEILMIELPKLGVLVDKSPCMTADEAKTEFSLEVIFTEAMRDKSHIPAAIRSRLTATVEAAGIELAAAIDAAVRRVLLEDEYLSREAHLDLITAHTEIVAALSGLALDSAQTELANRIMSRKHTTVKH